MSLRWIHENLEPPNCDEESSDIGDSCSDDSYDSDVVLNPGNGALGAPDDNGNYSNNNNATSNNNNSKCPDRIERLKRESTEHPDSAVIVERFREQRPRAEGAVGHRQPWRAQWPLAEQLLHQVVEVRLFCRTGYFIGITESGRARGFQHEKSGDEHVRLAVCPVSHGITRLRSVKTGLYLAFNSTGHLYGESKPSKENTEWEQWSIGEYDAFRSHKYADPGWWLGIKKIGRPQSGPKTAWGQKAVQFLTMRLP